MKSRENIRAFFSLKIEFRLQGKLKKKNSGHTDRVKRWPRNSETKWVDSLFSGQAG